MPSIKVYAELLLHLRQVTVYVSLDPNTNSETSLDLSSDLQSLTVHHGGESARLQLPAQVAANAALKLPSAPVSELSYRLPILEHELPAYLTNATVDNYVPWSAEALAPATSISCRNCNQILVGRSAVSVWKNLPSENWAEMMDFWHCHKPDHEEQDYTHSSNGSANGTQKGYTANSKLVATPGVGFVDLSYLLLAMEDCCGMKVRSFVLGLSLAFSLDFVCSGHYPRIYRRRATRRRPVPELSIGLMDRSPIQFP